MVEKDATIRDWAKQIHHPSRYRSQRRRPTTNILSWTGQTHQPYSLVEDLRVKWIFRYQKMVVGWDYSSLLADLDPARLDGLGSVYSWTEN